MDEQHERQKLEQIGRQAMNIQMVEAVIKTVDSDGNPVDDTGHAVAFIYNLEKISREEVESLLHSGDYAFDSRILQMDMETARNIFPHRGEAKKNGITAYWKPCANTNDFINCECSNCGCKVPAIDAVQFGQTSSDYVGIIYRFCPRCGSPMACKPKEPRKENEYER